MSWIVQNLLTNWVRIREKSSLPELENLKITSIMPNAIELDDEQLNLEAGYPDPRIESDELNDLLMIEKAIKELYADKLLSDYEMRLIEMLKDGSYKKDVSQRLGKNRGVIIDDFDAICDRIAFYLGGYFTDDGYIDYMITKYKLSDEDGNTIREYIKSNYRHRIVRTPYRVKET